jgi:hypothetical protein
LPAVWIRTLKKRNYWVTFSLYEMTSVVRWYKTCRRKFEQ